MPRGGWHRSLGTGGVYRPTAVQRAYRDITLPWNLQRVTRVGLRYVSPGAHYSTDGTRLLDAPSFNSYAYLTLTPTEWVGNPKVTVWLSLAKSGAHPLVESVWPGPPLTSLSPTTSNYSLNDYINVMAPNADGETPAYSLNGGTPSVIYLNGALFNRLKTEFWDGTITLYLVLDDEETSTVTDPATNYTPTRVQESVESQDSTIDIAATGNDGHYFVDIVTGTSTLNTETTLLSLGSHVSLNRADPTISYKFSSPTLTVSHAPFHTGFENYERRRGRLVRDQRLGAPAWANDLVRDKYSGEWVQPWDVDPADDEQYITPKPRGTDDKGVR